MQRDVFRADPVLPAAAMKTYQLIAPLSTHFRAAACAEVECAGWREGWRTVVDVATDLGKRQAKYIRDKAGRAYRFTKAGTLVTFVFPAGQRCFTEHRVPLEREPLYIAKEGDWRGNPRGTAPRQHTASSWVDDFATHQDKLAEAHNRG